MPKMPVMVLTGVVLAFSAWWISSNPPDGSLGTRVNEMFFSDEYPLRLGKEFYGYMRWTHEYPSSDASSDGLLVYAIEAEADILLHFQSQTVPEDEEWDVAYEVVGTLVGDTPSFGCQVQQMQVEECELFTVDRGSIEGMAWLEESATQLNLQLAWVESAYPIERQNVLYTVPSPEWKEEETTYFSGDLDATAGYGRGAGFIGGIWTVDLKEAIFLDVAASLIKGMDLKTLYAVPSSNENMQTLREVASYQDFSSDRILQGTGKGSFYLFEKDPNVSLLLNHPVSW